MILNKIVVGQIQVCDAWGMFGDTSLDFVFPSQEEQCRFIGNTAEGGYIGLLEKAVSYQYHTHVFESF